MAARMSCARALSFWLRCPGFKFREEVPARPGPVCTHVQDQSYSARNLTAAASVQLWWKHLLFPLWHEERVFEPEHYHFNNEVFTPYCLKGEFIIWNIYLLHGPHVSHSLRLCSQIFSINAAIATHVCVLMTKHKYKKKEQRRQTKQRHTTRHLIKYFCSQQP